VTDMSPAAGPVAPRVTAVVTVPGELAVVRRLAADVAARAGLPADRSGDLTVAISEVVANAITHGVPPATVTLAVTDGTLLITVHDQGTTAFHHPDVRTRLRHVEPAPPERVSGRGLWLAAQLCDRVTAGTDPDGTTVTLAMNL
jgi:anti-sigma regulatory factor (Ser/Thr protein kinase)